MTMIKLISFGYGHGTPPAAQITLDVRHLFRDPHVSPTMRTMTGRDQEVIDSVMRQQGAADTVHNLTMQSVTLDAIDPTGDFTLAIGCVGGRHRSVVLVNEIADMLAYFPQAHVTVTHRDIDLAVIVR